MSIKDELEGSKKYSFTMIPGTENSINNKYGLLDLTPENVYLVEAMIRTDSAYSKTFDLNEGKTDAKGKVNGSTAYCMRSAIGCSFRRPRPITLMLLHPANMELVCTLTAALSTVPPDPASSYIGSSGSSLNTTDSSLLAFLNMLSAQRMLDRSKL